MADHAVHIADEGLVAALAVVWEQERLQALDLAPSCSTSGPPCARYPHLVGSYGWHLTHGWTAGTERPPSWAIGTSWLKEVQLSWILQKFVFLAFLAWESLLVQQYWHPHLIQLWKFKG